MLPVTNIERIVAPAVESLGFELVRICWLGGRTVTLQIMAERPNGEMSADDCAELSRSISAILDVEDPIQGEYMLEVSSPGIDRPLVKLADFERFSGLPAKLETRQLIDGRRRFRGKLLGVDQGCVRIEIESGVVNLPYDEVDKAQLLLTDELIEASKKTGPAGHRAGNTNGAEDGDSS
ncbi:MAG: ribosome maturation factor RimP [Sphingomonadales bacterium]